MSRTSPRKSWVSSVAVFTLFCSSMAAAQTYSLSRSSLDGGGVRSTADGYTLDSTLGQADAGPTPTATGHDPNTQDDYQLNGGLWASSSLTPLSDELFADGFESP